MKFIYTAILVLYSVSLFADSCGEVANYDEITSTIYVVCPDLADVTNQQAEGIIETIFSSRKFEPDEYQIYFVRTTNIATEKEINSKSLVGKYYTHDNALTIWPNIPSKKRVIHLNN